MWNRAIIYYIYIKKIVLHSYIHLLDYIRLHFKLNSTTRERQKIASWNCTKLWNYKGGKKNKKVSKFEETSENTKNILKVSCRRKNCIFQNLKKLVFKFHEQSVLFNGLQSTKSSQDHPVHIIHKYYKN